MIKSWLVFPVLLGLGAAVGGAYTWHQATQLPVQYRQVDSGSDNPTAVIPITQQAVQAQAYRVKLQQQLAAATVTEADSVTAPSTSRPVNPVGTTHVTLSEAEINQLVVSDLTTNPATQAYLPAIRGVKTEIRDGQLKSGAVINLSKLPLDQLSVSEKQVIEQLVRTFPLVAQQDIYVAVKGQPASVNGQMQLQDGAEIQIGNLSVDLKTLAQRLNISQAALEQQLTLKLGNWQIQQVQLQDNQAVLQGAAS